MTDLIGPASAANSTTTRPALYRVFGAIDTWFKDCSSPTSQDGTAYEADFFNGLLGQIRTLIRGNGNLKSGAGPVVPEVNTTDAMLLDAVQLLIARGQPNCALDTGTADALVAAPATPWPEYVEGARLWLVKSATAGPNATTAPNLAVSGLAPLEIVRRDGSAVAIGDLPAGVVLPLMVHNNTFRLVSLALSDILALTAPAAAPYTGQTLASGGYYVVDTSQGTNFQLPNPAAVPVGWRVRIKAINTPTGFQTSQVSVAAGSASQALNYGGTPHTPFYLIGNGEGFWFENTGTSYDVLTAAQPGSFGIYASNPGGASSAAGTGSNIYMPISAVSSSVPGAAAAFNRSSTVASLNVPVSGIYQIIAATSIVGQSSTVQQGQLIIADSTSVNQDYYNIAAYANQSFPANLSVPILVYLKQGSSLSAVINCPSGQNYVPYSDVFSVFLQRR